MSQHKPLATALLFALAAVCGQAHAFDSGSTGEDGAFNPTVNTEVQLPENGVLNYTSVNIPPGVVVTFSRNTTNTPVVMLASGSVTISGIIDVSGGDAPASGAAGDGNIGDDGVPGLGGPGGFDGGRGGAASSSPEENISGAGFGPGAAGRSTIHDPGQNTEYACGGSGGGFGSQGGIAGNYSSRCEDDGYSQRGHSYGQPELLPLVGGSGGAGGVGYLNYIGGGGGAGGGAILLASSGTITVDGEILANGGSGGASDGQGAGGAGGSGSGGAIKLMASVIEGEGAITASGGARSSGPDSNYARGGAGGDGRIRLEAESMDRTSGTDPAYTFGEPGPVFVAGMPTVRIASVAGVDAPDQPTGSGDIQLPESTTNPVDVEFETTGIPVGNTVTVRVTPAYGDFNEYISDALSGNETLATASTEVDLPAGPSVLMATVSYEVAEDTQQQALLQQATGGELVKTVSVQTDASGNSKTVLTTRTGRQILLDG
ncbi:hypothetical protein [Wenzhouxiangella sp. EGI_FJ10409]|uniref:hypothetical protein n=1 Tax=Wenzhouxiangella sp. EGI_FJ10409 TaxID=3243767 RepID=UPI0035D87DF0